MFDIRYLLLIILIGISLYLIYNIYTFQTKNFDKLKNQYHDSEKNLYLKHLSKKNEFK